jgi:hypothetical protein
MFHQISSLQTNRMQSAADESWAQKAVDVSSAALGCAQNPVSQMKTMATQSAFLPIVAAGAETIA